MLDSAERMKGLDSRDMLRMVADMPDHLSVGLDAGSSVDVGRGSFDEVVVCGLGGSAISGDMVSAWLAETSSVPISVERSYSVPSHVGSESLVVALSYSGNTEETLSMVREAKGRGAAMVAVSSGGKLKEVAEAEGMPYCAVPSGLVPRATVGYMFGTLSGILERAGLCSPRDGVDEAKSVLAAMSGDCGPDVPTVGNPAKKLAHELHGTIPVTFGHGLSRPVAKRWANQFNENAKMIAFSGELPEMNHNGIVGWIGDARSQGYSAIFLDHDAGGPRMARRVAATKEMLRGQVRVFSSHAVGNSPVARMFSLVMVGDYVSVYSSFLRGEDPSTTVPIEELKKVLSEKVE